MKQIEAACAFFETGKLVDGVRCLQSVVNDADRTLSRCGDRGSKSAQRLATIRGMAADKIQAKLRQTESQQIQQKQAGSAVRL